VLDGEFEELDAGSGTSAVRHEPATLVFHPAGATHTNVISARGSLCLTVEIAPAVMESLEGRASVAGALGVSRRGAAHWFAYKLRDELHSCDDLTPLVVDGVALALLGEFARRPDVRVDRTPPSWLGQTRERLHEEFASPPSLGALAAAAGVHRVHLARAFRAHYACTVGEYVRQRRIEHACRRLATTAAPLSEVALSAGFADQSHFTTTFRRLVGITPSAFRARTASPRVSAEATHPQRGVTAPQDRSRSSG
jgi:AraC family transcriptional regulator